MIARETAAHTPHEAATVLIGWFSPAYLRVRSYCLLMIRVSFVQHLLHY
jgi:hypothetical protein